jgi:Trypsin-like peptidase domain
MQRRMFLILMLVLASAPVEAECIDPATLAHSTVSITRYFDDKEQAARPGVLGISGTGWFISSKSMVTVEHVAASMNLSQQSWKDIEIRKGETKESIPARIRHVAGSYAEKIAVLELQTSYSDARGFELRMEPLVPEEPVVSLAYPGSRPRVAGGRFVRYGDDERLAGTALLEMYDGNDRLVLDHGASGAPVVDCAGRVVAVVSNLVTTTMPFMSRAIRISTAWGTPNVVSVPVPALKDFSAAE